MYKIIQNLPITNSKFQKMKKSQQQAAKDCYNKLANLKISISDATDYCCLEKSIQKLEKIKAIGFSMETSKSKREITSLINTCDLLIKEKIKFFKKKLRGKIANPRMLSQSNVENLNDSNLKNCKSADNFKTASFNGNRNQSSAKSLSRTQTNFQTEFLKRDDSKDTQVNFSRINCTEDSKTQSLLRRSTSNKDFKTLMKQKFSSVNTQLETFKSKIKQIEQKVEKDVQKENIKTSFEQKNQFVLQKYERKLRQKILQNEQLKTKNQYLSEKNEELKNRVLNEHRRQNDYIQSLKFEINTLRSQFTKVNKQRENALEYISLLQKQSDALNQDIKRTVKKFQDQKKKRQYQIQAAKLQNNTKFEEMRREIEYLSRQQVYMKEMQKMVQNQSLDKNKLQSKYHLVLKQNDDLRNQIGLIMRQNQKKQQLIENLRDQIKIHKANLEKGQIINRKLEEQLFQNKKELIIMRQQKQYQSQDKETNVRNKATKLKQVRQMLQELK